MSVRHQASLTKPVTDWNWINGAYVHVEVYVCMCVYGNSGVVHFIVQSSLHCTYFIVLRHVEHHHS